MSAKYSINWHEIGFVQTTIQLIGVTLGQGRWIQMHEAAGRKCSGWGVMRITAIPGTGKHEGTSGREDGRSPKLSKPSGNGKQNRGLNNAWTKEGGEKQVREINGNTRNKGETLDCRVKSEPKEILRGRSHLSRHVTIRSQTADKKWLMHVNCHAEPLWHQQRQKSLKSTDQRNTLTHCEHGRRLLLLFLATSSK